SLDRIITLVAVIGFLGTGAFLFLSYFGGPTSEQAFVSIHHRLPDTQQPVSGLEAPLRPREPRTFDRRSEPASKPTSTENQLARRSILSKTPDELPTFQPSSRVVVPSMAPLYDFQKREIGSNPLGFGNSSFGSDRVTPGGLSLQGTGVAAAEAPPPPPMAVPEPSPGSVVASALGIGAAIHWWRRRFCSKKTS